MRVVYNVLLLSCYTILDTRAAENGGADESGHDAGADRRRHEPEAPAEHEARRGDEVVDVLCAQELILRKEGKEPADRVEHEREQDGNLGADDKVESKAVFESSREESYLCYDDEHECQTIESCAGGDESGRIGE